jgi:hypothetical protein
MKTCQNYSKEDMVTVMSNEYAKISGVDEGKVFSTMWNSKDFNIVLPKKKDKKKRLKFWKK